MMQQATQDPNAAADQFRCPSCGGVLLYDPAVSALKCKHCKAVAPPSMLAHTGPGPREIPLQYGLSMPRGGLGLQMASVSCNECGATVQLSPHERATACAFCASPMVVQQAQSAAIISPESLVPFLVPQDRAVDAFKEWLKGLWLRPNDLTKLAKLEGIHGVYVPYWTFDADVHSDWTAERGWYYQEVEVYEAFENGERVMRERTVTKTRWESASGWRRDHYDDVLVCASRGIPGELVDQMTTFDTRRLLPYAAGYLVGWRAESYALDLPDAWRKGQTKIASEQEGRCARDIGGDTHRGLSATHRYANETFKHILLPVYVAAYRYRDKPFQVLVNGQTAEVVGKAPWSFWKIAALVLFALAIVGGGIAFVLWQQGQQQQRDNLRRTPAATTTAVAPRPVTPTAPPATTKKK